MRRSLSLKISPSRKRLQVFSLFKILFPIKLYETISFFGENRRTKTIYCEYFPRVILFETTFAFLREIIHQKQKFSSFIYINKNLRSKAKTQFYHTKKCSNSSNLFILPRSNSPVTPPSLRPFIFSHL